MTVYILIAIRHEERDLVGMFGDEYEDYRGRAGMLIPRLAQGLEQPHLRARGRPEQVGGQRFSLTVSWHPDEVQTRVSRPAR